MTSQLEKAVKKLHEEGCALAVLNGGGEFVSYQPGLAPLVNLLKNSPELLRGGSVADKIVGKAAAFLLLYGGVKEVYAEVISSHALAGLERAGVKLEFNKKVPFIKNRAGTDTCPMEKRVLDIDDVETGAAALLSLFGAS